MDRPSNQRDDERQMRYKPKTVTARRKFKKVLPYVIRCQES
ncbi:hypothetical protein LCGC14_1205900 [marine sediment metagenome]|uniref:Uncharacterized protein n=1 Tax=marine sediment metagenome TaxID=412755 RepID=A0A0F9M2W5_9ZZZZ